MHSLSNLSDSKLIARRKETELVGCKNSINTCGWGLVDAILDLVADNASKKLVDTRGPTMIALGTDLLFFKRFV